VWKNEILLAATLVMLADCVSGSRGGQKSAAPLTTAEIVVRPSQRVAPISPYIYGASVEWVENGNRILDPASGQLRADIVSLLKPLRLPILRFPGGILADYYHWRDAVGPRDKRPKRQNPMDDTTHENNFGTDEFIQLCRALGAEAIITANFGTGTLDETLAWQQYFTDKGFPVKYWEIGNEIYLAENRRPAPVPGNDARIYKTPSQYAAGFREWASALHAKDHNVEIGAIAGTYNTGSQNRDWLSVLLAQAAPDADFIALHDSFAPLILGKYDYADPGKREEAYLAMFAQPYFAGEDIHDVQEKSLAVRNPPSKIAITEHFPLFGGGGGRDQVLAILDQSRTLAAGLYTASLFNTYMRNQVSMATYNLAVSKWFGALVTDTDQGLIRTPTYYVFSLYRNHMVGDLVFSQVNGPEYSTGRVGTVKARSGVPYLDAVASLDPSRNLELAVINRHPSQPVNARIQVEGASGTVEVTTLTGPSANAVNGSALSPTVKSGPGDQVAPRTSSWSPGTNGDYTFPPASLTIFRWSGTMARSGLKHVAPLDRGRHKTEEP